MSIEELLNHDGCANAVQAEQFRAKERNTPLSAVRIMANTYITKASEGLKALSGIVDEQHIEVASEVDFLQALNVEQRSKVILNQAGFFMGLTLHGIEDALIEKVVDDRPLVTAYNNAVTGTHLDTVRSDGNHTEALTDEQWRALIGRVKSDPTFGDFFDEGIDDLPKLLKHLVVGTGLIVPIKQTILPVHREQTTALLAQLAALRAG